MQKLRQTAAFSLPELLIVLMLISILGNWALPSLLAFMQTQQNQALTQLIAGHLTQARTHSAVHQRDIEICGSSDGINCDNQWHKGWLIRDPGSAVRLLDERLPEDANLLWKGYTQRIRFHADGTSPLSNGRFLICANNQEVQYQLIINRQGRVRIIKGLEPGQAEGMRCP